MPEPTYPGLMCKKIELSENPSDPKAGKICGALVRSRRHKSPEAMPENTIAIAYEFNQDERTAIAAGAPVFIAQVTHGKPPFETLVHVGTDVAAEYYGVEQATQELLEEQRQKAQDNLDAAIQSYQGTMRDADALRENPEADQQRMKQRVGEAMGRLNGALMAMGHANIEAGF